VWSNNEKLKVVNVTLNSGLKYEILVERETEVYVKLTVITFVTSDVVLMEILVINRKY
jgi:hypothetical protein